MAKKKVSPEDLVNAMFAQPGALLVSDKEINKQTGIWKRAHEQIGIPLPPETRAKISAALTGRKLSAETRAKISAAHKLRHANKLARAVNPKKT